MAFQVTTDASQEAIIRTDLDLFPITDPELEVLAKKTAFRDDLSVGDTDIAVEGYQVDHIFEDDSTGAFALGLTSPNRPPVLAFEGAEGNFEKLKSTNPLGIGLDQFEAIQSEVTDWLTARVEPPYLTGHSLGAALAQRTASAFTGSGNELGRVVTFNSPGISQSDTEDFDSSLVNDGVFGVTHYIAHGDWISLVGGQGYNIGNWKLGSFSTLDSNTPFTQKTLGSFTQDKHLTALIDKTGGNPNFPNKPDDLVLENQGGTSGSIDPDSNLSNPNFSFLTVGPAEARAEFLTFLVGTASIENFQVPGTSTPIPLSGNFADFIAKSLTTREGAENLRQAIGNNVFTILANATISTAVETKEGLEAAFDAGKNFILETWEEIRDLPQSAWDALPDWITDGWDATDDWGDDDDNSSNTNSLSVSFSSTGTFTSADVWKLISAEWTDQAWDTTTEWTPEIWQDTTTWTEQIWSTPFLTLQDQFSFLSTQESATNFLSQATLTSPTNTSNTQIIEVPVALSQTSTETITIDYQTANGTGNAGKDYFATSGTLTFEPGETQETIPIEIVTDTLSETGETLLVNFSGPNNARFVSDSQIKVTFAENLPPSVATPISNQIAIAEEGFFFAPSEDTFQDPNEGDTLTFSAQLENSNHSTRNSGRNPCVGK